MNILQSQDAMNAPDLQIWNNAAFDHGEFEPFAWATSNPDCVNLTLSLESDNCNGKENRSPNGPIGNSQVKLLNLNLNLPLEPDSASPVLKGVKWKESKEETFPKERERDIDSEIEEIEREISRLSSRLEALRLEKAEQNMKTIERPRGRIVPAKFMEKKQGIRDSDEEEKKIDGARVSGLKPKIGRRGVSLGPAEIASAMKSRPSIKSEITPIPSAQIRRKSCFWKLQEIDELKVTKERRKSLSLTVSPKTKKTCSKALPQKQAQTTVGSKRSVRKEENVISLIQPKTLFKEGDKSVKKPAKPGRVVPSRYNQMTISAARKRSFPENENEEGDRTDKRRASQESNTEAKEKAKKRWEIPREVVIYKSEEEEDKKKKGNRSSPETQLLPKIRIARELVNESPRDSGPAKRVAELAGRRSYFGSDEDEMGQGMVCQALSFIEE